MRAEISQLERNATSYCGKYIESDVHILLGINNDYLMASPLASLAEVH